MRVTWRSLTKLEKTISVSMFLILLLTLIGPWIAPQPTETAIPSQRLLPPSGDHFFGTDANGMDIFSRVLASFRVDVAIAVIATTISVVVGSAVGVLVAQLEGSGAKGKLSRIVAEVVLRVLDVIQAFPVFIFAMVLVAIRGTGTTNIVAAVAFVNFPVFIRLVRSEVLSLQKKPYTEAAHAIGNSNLRIGFKHLRPNAVPAVIVQVSVTIGFAILLTAGLSFVGAGISPPTPELGSMIAGGARYLITGQWWPAVFPGIFLAYTVFTFAIFGETVSRVTSGGRVVAEGSGPEAASLDPQASAVTAGVTSVTSTPNAPATALELGEHTTDVRHVRRQPDRHHDLPPATAESLVKVNNLTVGFDVQSHRRNIAVEDVSLVINPGDRIGIVGETGSGKSVLVRAILNVLPENATVLSGEVIVAGRSVLDRSSSEMRDLRGDTIAPILPNPKAQLNPLVRIGKMFDAVLRAHDDSLDRDEIATRSRLALEQVGISDPDRRLRQYPHELSGGMAQRVCIALSLLHSPRVLIADEPTAGLDVTVQRQVLDVLADRSLAHDAAQLIVTRDLSIVAHYCTWMGVMQGGRLVEFGRTLDVFDNPQHAHTTELIQAVRTDEECRVTDG